MDVWLAWAAEGDDDTPLARRPELPGHLQFVWDAFWAMQGDRQLGFGAVGPIPSVAIDKRADRIGLDGIDEFDRFERLIHAMDRVFLDDARKKQAAAQKAAQKK